MAESIDEAKKRLENEKEKIRLKEKLIRDRERKMRAKRFQEIGRLAHKAEIDLLDSDALLGAFLEIQSRKANKSDIAGWKEKASALKTADDQQGKTPMIVALKEEAPTEVKRKLSDLNFKWNSFRKEYYGHGNRGELSEILENIKHELEVVD